MQGFMTLTKDEDLPARARATELVGIIGMAVGRNIIGPVLPSFIEAAIEVCLPHLFFKHNELQVLQATLLFFGFLNCWTICLLSFLVT